MQNAGIAGIFGYTAFFAASVFLCLPCTPLEILPGFLFGFWIGLPVAIAGKNLGNLAQILIARHFFRTHAERFVQRYESSRIIEHIISHGGMMPIMIFRAIALPLYVKNVFLAVTNCSLRVIMLSCLCTGFPFAVMWTFLGTKAKGVVEILNGDQPSLDTPWWMTYVLPLLLAPLFLFLYRYVRTAWRNAVEQIKREDKLTSAKM